MNLANKTFKNTQSGKNITVIDSLGDFAILKNGGKLNISDLLDSNKYVEDIDPNTFLNSHYDRFRDLAEQIVNTPVVENSLNISSDSAVIISSVEEEKDELAKKYGINNESVINSVSRQNEAFEKILNPQSNNEKITKVDTKDIPIKPQFMQDPIYQIFKNTKKSVDLNFSIQIEDKIPRLDFIEMMEDSYETSIIEFLSKEFTNKILSNPSLIEEQISYKIREMVFGPLTKASTESKDMSLESETTLPEVIKKKRNSNIRKKQSEKESTELNKNN